MKNKNENKKVDKSFLSLLPKKMDFKEFGLKVQKYPSFLKSELSKNPFERENCVRQITTDWFHVTQKQFEVYECFDEVLRSRYEQLDSASFMATLEGIYEWNDNCKDPDFIPKTAFDRTVDGFTLIGPSGLGKTLMVNTVLRNCFPRVIKHNRYLQLVHLKVNCSNIGSTKALCYQILNGFDDALNTEYYKSYSSNFYTAEKLIPVIADKAHLHRLGVLIIDEVNHLVDVVGQSKSQVIAFLKNLNQGIGLPIVYIGTPEAIPVLAGNFQIARRSQGIQTIMVDRYQANDPQWDRLLKSLWRNQVLLEPGELTREIRDTYYEYSQGILDVLVKLHVRAQRRALSLGLESIDQTLLETVSKDHNSLTNPMINAIRSNDRFLMGQYRDISMESLRIACKLRDNDQTATVTGQLSSIFDRDFSPDEIKFCLLELLKKDPTLRPEDLFSLTKDVLHETKHKSHRKKGNSRGQTHRQSRVNDKKNYHDVAKSGIVKNLSSFARTKTSNV